MTQMQKELNNLVRVYEYVRYAYFWRPPMTASLRRSIEENSVPKITWEEGGHSYSAEIAIRVSRKHVYVHKGFYKDGEKTTWTAIRNSIQRITSKGCEVS